MDMRVNPENLALDAAKAQAAAKELNKYLANLQVMYMKVHNLHWNVVGKDFFDIHAKTQVVYEAISEKIDVTAERIKMIGQLPIGSLYDALMLTTIQEIASSDVNGPIAAAVLVQDLQILIQQLRSIQGAVEDSYTGGLVGDDLAFFEKQHWLFSAYLKNV